MHTGRRLARASLLAVAAALGIAAPATAQVDKPVHLLVGFAAGGSADIAARLVADHMKDELKQAVIVENRPGAGGRIAAGLVKNAPADGSVVMLAPIVVTVLAPMVFSKLPYDPSVDFAPVAMVGNYQFALSVAASHPARNMKELLAWYRAHPDKANFGSPAPGSLPHFFGVMIGKSASLDLVHVPFSGGGPMMTALMGDQITAAIDTLAEMVDLHKSGRVRILATSGSTRSPLLPDVPTFQESGLADVSGNGVVRRLCAGEDASSDGAPAQCGHQQGAGCARRARAFCPARPGADWWLARGPGGAHGAGHGEVGAGGEGFGLSRGLRSASGPMRPRDTAALAWSCARQQPFGHRHRRHDDSSTRGFNSGTRASL